jgi:diguanylate cyclase (GGDEF)-like protein/PAS domain S-box-containing protein
LSDDVTTARKIREKVSESLAVQMTTLLQSDARDALVKTMAAVVSRRDEILSVGLRRADGQLVAQTTEHGRQWIVPQDGRSTLTHVLVPIYADNQRWGDVEVSFRPVAAQAVSEWLRGPSMALVLTVMGAGFVLFYLYMRRVLQYLDPASVIPDRVRTAFDTLSEGVLVVDAKGRIALANAAFRHLHGGSQGNLTGRLVSKLGWLSASFAGDPDRHPWARVMRNGEPIRGESIEIPQESGEVKKTVINCSPVQDGHGNVRGCLVTFDDVTELDRANSKLRAALAELNASQQRIEKQNDELRHLANHDPLTGCLNRRAFFTALDPLFTQAQADGQALSCIMGDIDHFKLCNDRYGHAVGDRVIKAVAATIGQGLREADLLCRYGGEEFCVILPGVDLDQAAAVAERLREQIQAVSGSAVGGPATLKVTSSFGVASIKGMLDPTDLIQKADAALYAAKSHGRNRVVQA